MMLNTGGHSGACRAVIGLRLLLTGRAEGVAGQGLSLLPGLFVLITTVTLELEWSRVSLLVNKYCGGKLARYTGLNIHVYGIKTTLLQR